MLQVLKKKYFHLHYCMHALLSSPEVLLQCSSAAHTERILIHTNPPQWSFSFRNTLWRYSQRRKQSIWNLWGMESMVRHTTKRTCLAVRMWLFNLLTCSQVTPCSLPEFVCLSFALTSRKTHTVTQVLESY